MIIPPNIDPSPLLRGFDQLPVKTAEGVELLKDVLLVPLDEAGGVLEGVGGEGGAPHLPQHHSAPTVVPVRLP